MPSEPEAKKSAAQLDVKIWVDADACPVAVREIIFRVAKRLRIETTFVANQTIRVPPVDFIRAITVPYGADIADHEIVWHREWLPKARLRLACEANCLTMRQSMVAWHHET